MLTSADTCNLPDLSIEWWVFVFTGLDYWTDLLVIIINFEVYELETS